MHHYMLKVRLQMLPVRYGWQSTRERLTKSLQYFTYFKQ